MEKRSSSRHKTEQAIVCAFLTSRSFNDTCGGKMKNYCDSGLYAELQTRFKEGTVLLVRTTSSPSEPLTSKIKEGFRSISLAEVKWSKPISSNGSLCYGTGLRHLSL